MAWETSAGVQRTNRPVVASPQAAEGIDAADDTEFLIAANPAEEAAKVIALLADPARAARIGLAGRARMEARYRWSATLAGLPDLLFGHDAGSQAA